MSFPTRSTDGGSDSCTSRAKATLPPTRSFARDSRRRSLTSCERRSRDCMTLLETATLPGEDVTDARRAGDEGGGADHRADRRGPLSERARVGRAGRCARSRARPPGPRGGASRAGGTGGARWSRASPRVRPCGRAHDPSAHASRRRAQSRRERDSLRRVRSQVHARRRASSPMGSSSSRVATTGSASKRQSYRGSSSVSTAADRARASRGTGLGLAIVKHIVTQAGGTVEARGGRGGPRDPMCLSATSVAFTGLSPYVHDPAPRRPDRGRETDCHE